jgi:transcriptional regulator with XRE-family HTH domain
MKVVIADTKTLGLAIRNQRKKLGIRIDHAAMFCGMSVSTLSSIENGLRPSSLDKIIAVTNSLGLQLTLSDGNDDGA